MNSKGGYKSRQGLGRAVRNRHWRLLPGARVATEFLGHSFVNCVSKEIGKSLEIYYVGNSISDKYITDSIEVAGERDFSISMISKSGTMTEPAIACGVSGCLLGVNPFTRQERGAAKNMFVLPGKPGYEVEPEGLLKRL